MAIRKRTDDIMAIRKRTDDTMAIRKRTHDTMAIRKRTREQTKIYKILHRKLKIERRYSSENQRLTQVPRKGSKEKYQIYCEQVYSIQVM
jgi:predicted naringenin-chalcone synthase